MQLAVILACLLAFCGSSYAFCWTSGPYHIAASALAVGVGNLTSSSVCVYGNNANLNNECPFPCQALIVATWGDCYCRDMDYQPNAGRADPVIKSLSVKQVFSFLAGTNNAYAGNSCRTWMSNSDQVAKWKCSSFSDD